MPDRQYYDKLSGDAVTRNISARTELDEQFAIVGIVRVGGAELRKSSERSELGVDRPNSPNGSIGVLLREKAMKTLQIANGVCRIDYLCHLGARFGLLVPSESTQASISRCVA